MNTIQIRYDIRIPLHVLLVMDMQLCMKASHNAELLANTQELIRWSMLNGCPIVFTQDERTKARNAQLDIHECLIKPVRDFEYDRYKIIPKYSLSAAHDIIDTCTRIGYPLNEILVTGVEADTCVIKTVAGLAAKSSRSTIKVIRNACHASSDEVNNDELFWNRFTALGNVLVCTSEKL